MAQNLNTPSQVIDDNKGATMPKYTHRVLFAAMILVDQLIQQLNTPLVVAQRG
jgi:hypothetical protein